VIVCRSLPSSAQLLVLVAWWVTGLVLVALGFLVHRGSETAGSAAEDFFLSFWRGWCTLVLALQVWHFAYPIGDAARVCAVVAAAIGLALAGARPWIGVARGARHHGLLLVTSVALALWFSNHALTGARYGDVAAYFVPTVRWLVEYRIVPGLANLHAHYALNQSYFGYVAALEAGPFTLRSFHLANGLLVLVLGLRVLLAWARLLRLGRATGPVDAFYALLAPPVFAYPVSIWFTSPQPDVGVFALGAVASAELIALVTDQPATRRFHLRTVGLLAVTGITVKLSFAGFAVMILPLAFVLWLVRAQPPLHVAAREGVVLAGLGLVAIGPWMARNAIMSGLPLFPSAMIVLPVEWRVGADVEGWLRNTVYVGGWRAILGDPRWFSGILRNWGWTGPEVGGPIMVGSVALLAALPPRAWRMLRGASPAPLPLALILPSFASLLFCIVLSPVPRYAGATVWVLAATGILLVAGGAVCRARSLLRPLVLLPVAAATAGMLRTGMDPLWLPIRDFEVVAPIRWEPHRLATGSTVNVPIGIEACGNAPLPCTPYPNPALRWRRDGDLAAGFMLDPVLQERFRYDPGRREAH
jgi:hypothetical protein